MYLGQFDNDTVVIKEKLILCHLEIFTETETESNAPEIYCKIIREEEVEEGWPELIDAGAK